MSTKAVNASFAKPFCMARCTYYVALLILSIVALLRMILSHTEPSLSNFGSLHEFASKQSLHLLAVSTCLTLQADPSWGDMGPQQGPVGYQGRKRSNGTQQGSKQYAMEADAALAVLREQFPLYNQDSLTDVLKVGSQAFGVAMSCSCMLFHTYCYRNCFSLGSDIDISSCFTSLACVCDPCFV